MISKIITGKSFKTILLKVLCLLLVPFIAMQFSMEVNWTLFDFVAMGLLLLSAGLVLEIIKTKVINKKFRIGLIIVVILLFLLIWVELSVGVFDTLFAGH